MKQDGSFEGINYADLSRTAGFRTGDIPLILCTWPGHSNIAGHAFTKAKS
jgi:hypothetical protein